MRSVILVCLMIVVGCGKRGEPTSDSPTKPGADTPLAAVEFEHTSPQDVAHQYHKNAAAADVKYKDKVGKFLLLGVRVQRQGNKTILVAPAENFPRVETPQPAVEFHFTDEKDIANISSTDTHYQHIEGLCRGLVNDVVVFEKCRITRGELIKK